MCVLVTQLWMLLCCVCGFVGASRNFYPKPDPVMIFPFISSGYRYCLEVENPLLVLICGGDCVGSKSSRNLQVISSVVPTTPSPITNGADPGFTWPILRPVHSRTAVRRVWMQELQSGSECRRRGRQAHSSPLNCEMQVGCLGCVRNSIHIPCRNTHDPPAN
ncbi:hypothetical protein BDW22DRAFT_1358811 [Trametopsis cervina]|nr:hypothetical protein BDW22DRAFT_1358811 [Trametopsis cervina]